jgi:hypothetical protein
MQGNLRRLNEWPCDRTMGLPMLSVTKSLRYHYGSNVAEAHTLWAWITVFTGTPTSYSALVEVVRNIVKAFLVPQSREWVHQRLRESLARLKTTARGMAGTRRKAELARLLRLEQQLEDFRTTCHPFSSDSPFLTLLEGITGKTRKELRAGVPSDSHHSLAEKICRIIMDTEVKFSEVGVRCQSYAHHKNTWTTALYVILNAVREKCGPKRWPADSLAKALDELNVDHYPGEWKGKMSIQSLRTLVIVNQTEIRTTVARPRPVKAVWHFKLPFEKVPKDISDGMQMYVEANSKSTMKPLVDFIMNMERTIELRDFRVQLALAWAHILSVPEPLPMTNHFDTHPAKFVDHVKKRREKLRWKATLWIRMMFWLQLESMTQTQAQQLSGCITKISGGPLLPQNK